ncbi:MAG TPA: NBR1-Ig-like domain-containing protein [Spirillospora sp.]|nr:NBR1-Ig-like domain-containing protein [Spirillospora sp.]
MTPGRAPRQPGRRPSRGRYLQRAALPADNGTCSTPGKVRVPDTDPGRKVRVSVPVIAPDRPGSCWVGWKMVDGRGRQFLPGARPLYFMVNVAG